MQVYLRKIEKSDGETIVKWRNTPEILSHSIDQTIITEESNRIFYNENIETGKYIQYMVEKVDDYYSGVTSYTIASVYLKSIDKENGRCEVGMLPSSDTEWVEEGKVDALKLLRDEAFKKFKFHKIYAYIYADCADELKIYEKAGFVQEGYFKSEIRDVAGVYRDIIRLCIINE